MAKTRTGGRVIFTADWSWWEIVSRHEIETGDSLWTADGEQAAVIADTNVDDPKSWVCQVTEVAPRHSLIRLGDYVCCDGYGSDVVFVRLD